MRRTPQGFAQYYEEREKRLQRLEDGQVAVRVENRPQQGGGSILHVRVRDTGAGFDPQAVRQVMPTSESMFSGRGIALVRSLCERLEYSDGGRCADAFYRW